jgi:hypothetical protein
VCKDWHLIECSPDGAEAVVTVLPDLAAARAATPPRKSKPKRRDAK